MRNLIYLFVQYGGLIAFGVLEILCMYLVVNYNKKQEAIFVNSSTTISGVLYENFDQIVEFWNMSSVSDSLAEENARLLAKLRSARFVETILQDSAKDEKTSQRYTYIAADIVNNSVRKHNNNLTINRGANHGIRPHMGVFDSKGIVGIVRNVGPRFSHVMSILHKESKITAAIRRNNYFGPLIWKDNDPTRVTLSDIPKHAHLIKGDTVMTSGYSTIFPPGLMIGVVDTFWLEPGSNFYTIKVLLSNDLSKAKYVYVVNDLMEEEIKAIEEVADE